jgi:radical SAM protein (TIGR01212 family)
MNEHSKTPLYRSFQQFLDEHFDTKVQKISLNAGFTCPNRDGNKGYGGCTYCNNQSFNPDYCKTDKTITDQLKEGIRFFARKYPNMHYLAYFQAYTNTYGELELLRKLYEEALSLPDIRGLVIGTRPDCMPDSLLDYLESLSEKNLVLVEYGIESTLDRTLEFINRGHDYASTVDAIRRTAERKIPTGAHLILGLPGESRADLIGHARVLSGLPLQTIKLHQLQIIKGTRLAAQVAADPDLVHLPEPLEYVEWICDFLENLRPDIAVERFVSQSPPELLLAPNWGLKNYEFTHLVEKCLRRRGSWQGKYL